MVVSRKNGLPDYVSMLAKILYNEKSHSLFFSFDFPPHTHTPVNVELVKMRTIFELTGGRDSSEPRNMESMVRSSIIGLFKFPERAGNVVLPPKSNIYLRLTGTQKLHQSSHYTWGYSKLPLFGRYFGYVWRI